MNEPLDSVHTAGLQQDVSANYIVVGESETVAVGVVSPSFIPASPTDMALRGKVENGINIFRLQDVAHEARTENIPLNLRVTI